MKDYKMRRGNRQMSVADAKEVLHSGEYGVLSTIGNDGWPYGIPLNFAFDGERIYFHCAKDVGHKEENLNFSNKVSFCVVCNNAVKSAEFTEKFDSVIAFGTAQKADDNQKRYGLELLIKKYSSEFYEKGMAYIDKALNKPDVYVIEIAKISGKRHE